MSATKIEIVIPSQVFEPGDLVPFEIVVTSIQEFTVWCEPLVRLNGNTLRFDEKTITKRKSVSWPASFIMPEDSITIKAESWCESDSFSWRKDSTTNFTLKPGSVAGEGSGKIPIGLLVAAIGIAGVVILGREK